MGLNVKAICWRQHFKYLNQSAPSSSVKKISFFGNLIASVAQVKKIFKILHQRQDTEQDDRTGLLALREAPHKYPFAS